MLDDSTKLARFADLFNEVVGGREVAVALWRQHEGESVREIAGTMHVAESSLRTKLTRARVTLRRLGLMPEGWDTPTLARVATSQN